MIKFLKRLFMIGTPETKGEVVYGKLKDQVRPCYIPFSKDSGDKPVIATEQFVLKNSTDFSDQIKGLDSRVTALEHGFKPTPTHTEEKAFKELFANKENGFIYDFNNLGSMFQDVDGTIPVTGEGQEVRKVLDTSGNENHLVCAGIAPKLAVNNETGAYYLRFSGKEALWCEKNTLGGTQQLTLITHVTRDFKSTKGYEMYFALLGTTMRLCCIDRSSYTFVIDTSLTQSQTVDSKTSQDPIVGSVSFTLPELSLKVGSLFSKTSNKNAFTKEFPVASIVVGNSHQALGSNGVVGGMYALIGVVKYINDMSVTPVQEILQERAK